MGRKQQDRQPISREIWIIPHQYSCGGYWMADRMQRYMSRGVEYSDNLGFHLLSGRMGVLSEYQVKAGLQCCRNRGEIITEVWADSLPEGSRLFGSGLYPA